MKTSRRVIFSALALIAAVACVGCGRDPLARNLDARERMARALAEALPEDLARAPLRIIANPFINKAGVPPDAVEYHRAVLRGLSAGLRRPIREEDVVFPTLRDGAWEQPERLLLGKPTTRTPLSLLMTSDAFDRLIVEHPEARLFISIVGVPEKVATSAIWTNARAPVLALYLPDFSVVPDAKQWRAAFEQGRIVAAVIEQSGHPDGRVLRGADDAATYWPRSRK